MKVAEAAGGCVEHEWGPEERVTASGETHVLMVCQRCPAVAVEGPDLPFD